MPTPPDWDAIASPPGEGITSVKVALSLVSASLATNPRQFGPINRMP